MRKPGLKILIAALLVIFGVNLNSVTTDIRTVRAGVLPLQSTAAVATVTSTPSGPEAVVVPGSETQINLRSGPNTTYDKIGVLLVGQRVPAKGQSPGGDWVLVEYPGVPGGVAWVWSAYIKIVPEVALPIVEPPPSPTPLVTVTIDPTLAARFIVTTAPTRLPTFTPPPPLSIPTFTAINGSGVGSLPMGFIIMGLAAMGVLFGLVAFFQGK
jgi:uncharacterized protein YraI